MSKSKILSFFMSEEEITSSLSKQVDPSTFEVKVIRKKLTEEETCEVVQETTLILTYPGGPHLTRKTLEAAHDVKLIQFISVGYDNIDLEAATELEIPVANNPGWASTAVAEHTIMLMLMVLKKARERELHELRGKTLGILGLGSIGKEIARLVNAFGVTILYNNRNRLSEEEEAELDVTYRSFAELLEESDILSIHVPLTEETRAMIGRDEISRMKDGAIIVNTARKDVVNESAVFEALNEGKLYGFGTDFVPDRSLSGFGNVIMTPHVSGFTVEGGVRAKAQLFDNISRFLRGEKPLFLVNTVWPSEQ
jgi:lactate dehydrogenase-like 2-hydroxyacid dehydrogenase